MSTMLAEVLDRLNALPASDRAAVAEAAIEATKTQLWVPNPGPQTEAYFCEADELLYGGSAGSGKSDLVVGLSLTAHRRSLVLRRTNQEATKLVERYVEIIGDRDGWNGQDHVWRIDGRLIDIGGCQHEDDKQKRKGIPHDLKAFDELVDFTETQYLFITTWNRSTDLNQRCRVVATTNPPTDPSGLWVIRRWAAWLDPEHPNPAKSGEIRWYTTRPDGVEVEVDGRGPHVFDGKPCYARSRTFIRGELKDNPDLAATNYGQMLDSLPEELRDAYRDGKFNNSLKDQPFQCIPASWVRQAQDRWTNNPPAGVPMCTIGVDCTGGGDDPMTLAPRYDGYYAEIKEIPGREMPKDSLGSAGAGYVIAMRRDQALPVVDLGGGYGGSLFEHLRSNGVAVQGYKGAAATNRRSICKKFTFTNTRSAAYWLFREALDPDQSGGSSVALPPDQELLAELVAPSYQMTPNGIKLEPKEKVIERLGWSTNKADAVVMAWYYGPRDSTHALEWAEQAQRPTMHGQRPQVVMGRKHTRRR